MLSRQHWRDPPPLFFSPNDDVICERSLILYVATRSICQVRTVNRLGVSLGTRP